MTPLNCADKKRKCAAPFSWLKRLKGTDPVNSKQNLSELKATLLRKDLAIRDDAFKKAENISIMRVSAEAQMLLSVTPLEWKALGTNVLILG